MNVEEHDVRSVVGDRANGTCPVGAFAGDVHVQFGGEQPPNPAPRHGFIVDDQDPDAHVTIAVLNGMSIDTRAPRGPAFAKSKR